MFNRRYLSFVATTLLLIANTTCIALTPALFADGS